MERDVNVVTVLTAIASTVLVVIVGTVLLRIAGRKSISQMTIAETVVMISIGNVLVQPLVERSLGIALVVAATMVATIYFLSFLQVKYDIAENIFTGKSIVVIRDGKINLENLNRLRLTVDQLETQLREGNVSNIQDIKVATIEPSGQLGFELNQNSQNATKEDIERLVKLIEKQGQKGIKFNRAELKRKSKNANKEKQKNLFSEVIEHPAERGLEYGGPIH